MFETAIEERCRVLEEQNAYLQRSIDNLAHQRDEVIERSKNKSTRAGEIISAYRNAAHAALTLLEKIDAPFDLDDKKEDVIDKLSSALKQTT